MGAERNHRDRAVRFQGDWAGTMSAMPDHYTKSKLAITLGMVSSLVRDLKSGWRPGPKAVQDLVVLDLPSAPAEQLVVDDPEVDATDADRDSDDSELGEIAGPMIDFYIRDLGPATARVDPEPPRLHVRSLEDPTRPACARLQNKGITIAEMIWSGTFPSEVKEICHWCRKKRPEILEQLDGYLVATED